MQPGARHRRPAGRGRRPHRRFDRRLTASILNILGLYADPEDDEDDGNFEIGGDMISKETSE